MERKQQGSEKAFKSVNSSLQCSSVIAYGRPGVNGIWDSRPPEASVEPWGGEAGPLVSESLMSPRNLTKASADSCSLGLALSWVETPPTLVGFKCTPLAKIIPAWDLTASSETL